MAVTGVLNALVRVPLSALVGTTYGALVLAKLLALLTLRVRLPPPPTIGRCCGHG
jgi:putative copper resistance protein D